MLRVEVLEVLAAAALVVASAAAQAQLTLGVRVGYAAGVGDAYREFRDTDNGQVVRASLDLESQIPVQLDVLYRLLPELAIGAYVSYGFARAADEAMDGACMSASPMSCSATNVRAGVQVTYSLTRVSPVLVPWVGAGAGWEWTRIEVTWGSKTIAAKMNGPEFLNLQLGVDWQATRWLGVGPYVGYGFGRYRDPSFDLKGIEATRSSIHSWLGVGLRGKIDL